MAQRVDITLIDDLTNEEIKSGGGTTQFGLDGKLYEIDLSDKSRKALEKALAPYLEVARPAKPNVRPGVKLRRQTLGASPREIRDWGRSNGFEVPDRGRVPGHVIKAFDAAH